MVGQVSTHSRLKAAGIALRMQNGDNLSFNTQPPEGGWDLSLKNIDLKDLFQHTAA